MGRGPEDGRRAGVPGVPGAGPLELPGPGRAHAGQGLRARLGGTSNHLCLIDLRPKGVDGARAERIMEMAHIAVNKNTVPGDTSALVLGGIRIGTPALTSRGFLEADFEKVADFLDRAVTIAQAVDGKSKGKKFKDFREALESQDWPEIAELRGDVAEFARSFPTVGFEKSEIMGSPRRQPRTRPPAQFSGLPARALFDPNCGGGGGSISIFLSCVLVAPFDKCSSEAVSHTFYQ